MQQLPPDFRFADYFGPALYLHGQRVAMATKAHDAPDAPWRICFNPDRRAMRHAFVATEAGAVRMMTAWACRWEARLREQRPAARMCS